MDNYHELAGSTPKWWSKISVEPVMFLYMGSFMISSVVEQAFFVHKACLVDVGLPAHICANISAKENEEYNKRVQVVVSSFHQWESIASHAVPVLLALYLGAWSDVVGRKLPLILGLAGSVIYWFALLLNSLHESWPLWTVLYTATFPSALTGGSLVIFMSAISYVCDITSPEERTVRVTLLEAAYLLTMPVGVAFGSYLFKNVLGQSFPLMFLLSGVIMLVSVVYGIFRLEWRTNTTTHTRPISFFGTVRDTVSVITRTRQHHYKLYLRIIIIAMAVYTFQRDEKNMAYLYTILKFQWKIEAYSIFRTYQSSLYILGLLIGAPVLGQVLKLRDTTVVMIGALSHILARIAYATSTIPEGFYVGATLGTLGPIAAPVLRSMVSKLVPPSERGKAFSLLSVADTAVPILSGAIYSQTYNATIDFAPYAFFWVTVTTQTIVFICVMIIHCIQRKDPLQQAIDSEDQNKSSPATEA